MEIEIKKKNLSNKYYFIIFLFAFLTRYLFSYLYGVDKYIVDWDRYDNLANQILLGNFDLEVKLFIVAPLFPYCLALFKLIFNENYSLFLELFQIILSSFSVIVLSKISKILFDNKSIEFLTGILFCFYPITIYYVSVFSQESIFQSLFIFFIYFLAKYTKEDSFYNLIFMSIFFTLSLLTKSHIQLLIPFLIFVFIYINKRTNKILFIKFFLFFSIFFTLTFPYALYNKITKDIYVISSTGYGSHFLTGHNDEFYEFLTNSENLDPIYLQKLLNLDYDIFNKNINNDLTHSQKQKIYLFEGLNWIKENPKKNIKLIFLNLKNFLTPGVNINFYSTKIWLISFMISLPIFLFAYIEIIKRVLLKFKENLVILSIFFSMISFVVFFHHQGRFRTVTIEPLYIIYASSFIVNVFKRKN